MNTHNRIEGKANILSQKYCAEKGTFFGKDIIIQTESTQSNDGTVIGLPSLLFLALLSAGTRCSFR